MAQFDIYQRQGAGIDSLLELQDNLIDNRRLVSSPPWRGRRWSMYR